VLCRRPQLTPNNSCLLFAVALTAVILIHLWLPPFSAAFIPAPPRNYR
jgi:hypothetical protein